MFSVYFARGLSRTAQTTAEAKNHQTQYTEATNTAETFQNSGIFHTLPQRTFDKFPLSREGQVGPALALLNYRHIYDFTIHFTPVNVKIAEKTR